MADGDLTFNGSPLGVGTASTCEVRSGTANRLEYESPDAAEYGINGSAIIRTGLHNGELFNFSHLFTEEAACAVKEMAYLGLKNEQSKEPPYHVFLTDERCKVVDSNPPLYAYLPGSLEVSASGLTTKTHRIYKVLFRSQPICEGCIDDLKELSFVMQLAGPYFAAEQLPAPDLAVFDQQTIQEGADTSGGRVLIACFS